MGSKNRYDGINEYAIKIIRYKAKKLVGYYGFTVSDMEDIEQEMILDLLQRLSKFDPSRAKQNTFIAKVVEHKVVNLIEAQKAGVRDYRLYSHSLNDVVKDEDGKQIQKIETVSRDEYFFSIGKYACSQEELDALSIDIKRIISTLPENYRILCDRLQKENVSEVSQNTGIPRGAIYDLINKLKSILTDAGIKKS